MKHYTTSLIAAVTKLLKSLAACKANNNRKTKHSGKTKTVAVMVAMNIFTVLIVLMITIIVVSISS